MRDATTEPQAFNNDLRSALAAASAGPGAPMGSRLPVATGLASDAEYPVNLNPGDMVLPRLVIPRVKIKQEVAGYIESCFLSRTNIDGSVLKPSKEQLIQDLTELFHNMEEQAGYIDEPKSRRTSTGASRGRGEA